MEFSLHLTFCFLSTLAASEILGQDWREDIGGGMAGILGEGLMHFTLPSMRALCRRGLVRVSELGNHGCSDFETARAMSCLEFSVPHH